MLPKPVANIKWKHLCYWGLEEIGMSFVLLFRWQPRLLCNKVLITQAPVVQKVDSAIYRINHYPVDNCSGNQCVIHWIEIYPVDSAVQVLNNWGQDYNAAHKQLKTKWLAQEFEEKCYELAGFVLLVSCPVVVSWRPTFNRSCWGLFVQFVLVFVIFLCIFLFTDKQIDCKTKVWKRLHNGRKTVQGAHKFTLNIYYWYTYRRDN